MDRMALVNSFGECVSTMEDPFNFSKKRNDTTQDRKDYNCGGYALETYNWFLPFFSSHNFSSYVWREVCKVNNWEFDEEGLENGDTQGELIYGGYEQEVIEALASVLMKLDSSLEEEDAYDQADSIFQWGYWDEPAAMVLSIKFMLNAFPTLRIISDFSELEENEYGIAYACGSGDFHFIKFKDGVLTHKMGNQEIKTISDVEETFSELGYDSEITFFAKKIQ